TLLITSNMFISPGFAKESTDTSEENQVILYSPESEEDLILYEDEDLEEEQDSIKNNSPALLVEEIKEKETSLVEVEISEKVIQGYIDSESVIDPSEMIEEYKLYSEDENEAIPMYIDEMQEELLYELEEGTSILVNKINLKEQETTDYVHVTLNPEIEEVPEELEEEFENPEDVQGFVEIDHLIALDKEEALLSEREAEELIEEKEDESAKEEDSKATETESETEETKDLEKKKEPKEPVKEEETTKKEEESAKEEPKEKEKESETEEKKELKKKKEPKEPVKEEETTKKEEESAKEEPKEEANEEQKAASTMLRSVPKEKKTSRLGHIRSGDRPIYKTIGGKSFKATAKYQNKVYNIKREAQVGSEKYYLLSTSPSATNKDLVCMKAKDISTHSHKGHSKTPRALKIKGTDKATSKAWGGGKDTVHA